MKKVFFFAMLFISITLTTQAQQPYIAVISPAGSTVEGPEVSLAWTLGELAVQTHRFSEGIVTEGFNQSMILPKPVLEESSSENYQELDFWVGPNPTTRHLRIRLESEYKENGTLAIKNLGGQLLYQKSVVLLESDHTLDLSRCPDGMYIVNLYSERGGLLRSYKITKVH